MTQQLTHGGLPEGMSRWQLLGFLETARRQLGLSKGAIAYLKVAISCTMDGDYAPGRRCAFWMSVTKIADRVEVNRRQVSRIEADLIDRGFLLKTASDHSRRQGARRDTVIGNDFGINLAPLIERAVEIRAAAQKALFERDEVERLRIRIRTLFADIRKLESEDADEAAQEILPSRRPSTVQSYERLQRVSEALEAVMADFSADCGEGETSHGKDILPSPNTEKEKKTRTCTNEQRAASSPPRTTPAQVAILATEQLRDVIEIYWRANDQAGHLSWPSITAAARERAHQLGISGKAWQQSCGLLGENRAALCLVIADRNAVREDRYVVRDVGAAFVGMVRQEARLGAVVDSLLGELTAFDGRTGR